MGPRWIGPLIIFSAIAIAIVYWRVAARIRDRERTGIVKARDNS